MLHYSASMGGLFKTIFILLLLYLGVRLLGRLFGASAASRRPGSQFRRDEPQRPEGDVRVEYTDKSKANRGAANSEGEYIDFEELDKS